MNDIFEYPDDALATSESRQIHDYLLPYVSTDPLEHALKLTEILTDPEFRLLAGGIVGHILRDPTAMERCARRSQSHPLGFDKILIMSTKWYQIRLNLWPGRSKTRIREDIHDHRFDFVSTVLSGCLLVELYETATVGYLVNHFIDRLPASIDAPYALFEVGQVHLRKVSAHFLNQGSAYVTQAESLHRIIAAEGIPVLTLFLKFAASRQEANVMVDARRTSLRAKQERTLFTQERIQPVLAGILELMNS